MEQKTEYPGVTSLGSGRFRIRLQKVDHKTGRKRDVERVIKAKSPAEAAKQRELLELEQSKLQRRDRVRLEEYARGWMASKKARLTRATQLIYANALYTHITPSLGAFYMDAIEHDDLIAWRASQAGEPTSINGRLRVLKTMFRTATRELRLPTNPSAHIERVPEPRKTKRRKALTREELWRLLDFVRDKRPQWFPLVLTLARTGMRFGEATGLKWTDINFSTGEVTVRRSQWRGNVGETKTKSTRTIALTPDLIAALQAHRQDQIRSQVPWLAEGWLFMTIGKPNVDGVRKPSHLQSASLRKPLAHAAKEAGTPVVTAHCFRHTFNDLARRIDPSGQVTRSMTGHVTEEMTVHYSHVSLDEKRALVMRAQFGEGGSREGVSADQESAKGKAR